MKVVKLEDCINEIKSLDNNGYVTRSVNHICEDMRKEVKEFNAIPLDRIKEAIEEIKELATEQIQVYDEENPYISCVVEYVSLTEVRELLDKLIESEE